MRPGADEREQYERSYRRSYKRAFRGGVLLASLHALNAYLFIGISAVLAAVFTILSYFCLRAAVTLARDYHRLRRACEERGIEFPPP